MPQPRTQHADARRPEETTSRRRPRHTHLPNRRFPPRLAGPAGARTLIKHDKRPEVPCFPGDKGAVEKVYESTNVEDPPWRVTNYTKGADRGLRIVCLAVVRNPAGIPLGEQRVPLLTSDPRRRTGRIALREQNLRTPPAKNLRTFVGIILFALRVGFRVLGIIVL